MSNQLSDIENKITALLNMTVDAGCTEEEAARAAETAARLAAKYAIDQGKLAGSFTGKMVRDFVKTNISLKWVQVIQTTVAKMFAVHPSVGKNQAVFYGDSLDVKLACQAFASFVANAKKTSLTLAKEALPEIRADYGYLRDYNEVKMMNDYRRSYCLGYSIGLMERVATVHKELKATDSMALIPLDKKMVKASEFASSFVRKRQSRAFREPGFHDAFGQGIEDGRAIQVLPALS